MFKDLSHKCKDLKVSLKDKQGQELTQTSLQSFVIAELHLLCVSYGLVFLFVEAL